MMVRYTSIQQYERLYETSYAQDYTGTVESASYGRIILAPTRLTIYVLTPNPLRMIKHMLVSMQVTIRSQLTMQKIMRQIIVQTIIRITKERITKQRVLRPTKRDMKVGTTLSTWKVWNTISLMQPKVQRLMRY